MSDDAASIDAIVRAVLKNRAAHEAVVVSTPSGVHYVAGDQYVQSMVEFEALMAAAPGFPRPMHIPDGYRFATGHIEYGCAADGKYVLTREDEPADGVTVSYYAVDQSGERILGYSLAFTGEGEGDSVTISCRVQPPHDPHGDVIGVREDQTSRLISIDGMENGIAIDSDQVHFLFLRQVMDEPFAALIPGVYALTEVETYVEYHISVSATQMMADDLAQLFAE